MRSASTSSASSGTLRPSRLRASAQPADQPVRVHRPHLHPCALRFDGAHPFGALCITIEPRREHEQHAIRIPRFEQRRPVRHRLSLPGFPLGMRISTMRRSANSERLFAEARTSFQSAPRSMKCVSRSVKPAARARARIASAASAGEQRLVPRNEVGGQQVLLEVGRQRVGIELQVSPAAVKRCGSRADYPLSCPAWRPADTLPRTSSNRRTARTAPFHAPPPPQADRPVRAGRAVLRDHGVRCRTASRTALSQHATAQCDLCLQFSGTAGAPADLALPGKPPLVVVRTTPVALPLAAPRAPQTANHLPRGPPALT